MKLSHKTVQNMPTGNLKQIEAREAAYKKLVEAEKFVDTFDSLHAETMAKDNLDTFDQSPQEKVVLSESGSSSGLSDILASDVNGVANLKQTEMTIWRERGFFTSGPPKANIVELKMESHPKRDRKTYSRTQYKDHDMTRAANPRELKPHSYYMTDQKVVVVEGQGEDRTFRFGKIGMAQSAWESVVDLASSLGSTLAPLRDYIPTITF